ncbi:VanZ family protein [Nocardioides sp.]|uniref:VanZ family protein n=1 Tax=Nocardioides sp. TaxID=35761 RepID=UPI00271A1CF2|nr:VanZ family protein [Nocardioides sp.]MDO9456620.1 VanZ family protein [Nocardioides sp.]
MHRPVALVLVLVYSVLVVHLTLTDPSQGAWAFDLADRVARRASGGGLTWDETEVLANVALFVPLGFLLAVGIGRVWPAVSLCLLASAGVEWAQLQYVASRVPTIDDVVHNTLGGLIGALVAGAVLAVAPASRRDERVAV